MVRPKRKVEVLNMMGRMSGIRSVYQPLPGKVYYRTGIKLRSNLHIFMPIFAHFRKNPSFVTREKAILFKNLPTKPAFEAVKRPVLQNESVQISQKNGNLGSVINKDGHGEIDGETEKNNLNSKENDSAESNMDNNLVEKNKMETVVAETVETPADSEQICTCKCLNCHEKTMKDHEGHGVPKNDKSDEFAIVQKFPLLNNSKKVNEPVLPNNDNAELIKSMKNHPNPVNIAEYEQHAPKKRKLSKHSFHVTD